MLLHLFWAAISLWIVYYGARCFSTAQAEVTVNGVWDVKIRGVAARLLGLLYLGAGLAGYWFNLNHL